ncbi:Up-regulated during septation-domain-containing protein [Sporodiniella umbellata]|nr:Up-regulated during septation-domain-containing protein [Sporodiniella umbellata]
MSYPHLPIKSPFRIRDSHKTINIASNERWSLGIELEDMWHMKPVEHHLPTTQEDLFTQLLISQALLDSNDFAILSFEQVEKLKKERGDLQDLISTLSRSIQVETRIKNVSRSLGHMHNSRDSVLLLEQQTQSNANRLNDLMLRYEQTTLKAFSIQESLLKHTAAVLNRGTHVVPESDRAQVLDQLRTIVSTFEPSTDSKDPLALLQSIDRRLTPGLAHQAPWLSRLRRAEALLTCLYTQAEHHTQNKKALRTEKAQYKHALEQLAQRPTTPCPSQPTSSRLQEHSQAYESQLAQQRRTVQEHEHQRQTLLQQDRALQSRLAELDQQIKDTSRRLDQRDVRITRLKEELKAPPSHHPSLDTRQQAWETQRSRVEKEFDQLMVDYDGIIIAAMDFDSHRMHFDKQTESLLLQIQQLEADLMEEKMKKIGHTNNTTDLRKEFRMLISDIKKTHEQRLYQQTQANLKLKSQLDQLVHHHQTPSSVTHSIQIQTD